MTKVIVKNRFTAFAAILLASLSMASLNGGIIASAQAESSMSDDEGSDGGSSMGSDEGSSSDCDNPTADSIC